VAGPAREGLAAAGRGRGARSHLQAEPAVAIEQRRRLVELRTLDRQQAHLGGNAAGRRESAGLAVGGDNAVAGHDDRDRVLSHRLADRAGIRFAEPRRNGAVGEGRAGRDGAGNRVDAAVEFRDAVKVEHDLGEVAPLAAGEGHNAGDRPRDIGGRRRLARLRVAPEETRPRGGFARRGKLDADDAARAPHHGAAADRGVEEGEGWGCHGAEHPRLYATAGTWGPRRACATRPRRVRISRARLRRQRAAAFFECVQNIVRQRIVEVVGDPDFALQRAELDRGALGVIQRHQHGDGRAGFGDDGAIAASGRIHQLGEFRLRRARRHPPARRISPSLRNGLPLPVGFLAGTAVSAAAFAVAGFWVLLAPVVAVSALPLWAARRHSPMRASESHERSRPEPFFRAGCQGRPTQSIGDASRKLN
jgi:hypothetical protein